MTFTICLQFVHTAFIFILYNDTILKQKGSERPLIQKIKLNLWTGTYTVIRDAGSIVLTRRKTPAMNEFIKQAGTPVRDGYNLIYFKRKEKET